VPEMTARGFTEREIATMLLENPARALAVPG
jgi:predicted metal-dependent phosphotriesterase family hydrolase